MYSFEDFDIELNGDLQDAINNLPYQFAPVAAVEQYSNLSLPLTGVYLSLDKTQVKIVGQIYQEMFKEGDKTFLFIYAYINGTKYCLESSRFIAFKCLDYTFDPKGLLVIS